MDTLSLPTLFVYFLCSREPSCGCTPMSFYRTWAECVYEVSLHEPEDETSPIPACGKFPYRSATTDEGSVP